MSVARHLLVRATMLGHDATRVIADVSGVLAIVLISLACASGSEGGGDGSKAASAGQGGSGAVSPGEGGSGAANPGQGGAGATSSGDGAGGGTTSAGDGTTGFAGGGETGNAAGGTGATGESLPECPNSFVWPADSEVCRSSDECSDGRTCDYPCPPIPSIQTCESDADCGDQICELSNHECSVGVLVCRPRCTEDSCPPGWACADSGHCEQITMGCDEGYECPAEFRCEPESDQANSLGCVLRSCSEDYDCPEARRCAPESDQADRNGCEPGPCSEGYPCPENYTCDPENTGLPSGCRPLGCEESGKPCSPNYDCTPSDSGGSCMQRSCTRDDECDCGHCAEGVCRTKRRCIVRGLCYCG